MKPLPPERTRPLQARLAPQRRDYPTIMAAHDRAVAAGAEGYLDPASGAFVFTARSLWERGRCCKTGCRHCPYEPGPRGPLSG